MADEMPTVVFVLIGWAKARGRLAELILGAADENPGSAELREVAERFRFAEEEAGEEERIVQPMVPFANAGEWLDRMARLRRAVCRFEPQPSKQSLVGHGTGFLVAPDVLTTNFHVAGGLSADQAARAVAL
jgi:hypothetical protein